MAQLSATQYLRLSAPLDYGVSDGLYWDKTNSQLVMVIDDAIVDSITASGSTADLELSGETRGDILRRGATAWERHVAKTTGQVLAGDGTDVKSMPITGDVSASHSGGNLATTVTDLTISGEQRGDLLRRGASAWERASFKTAGAVPVGDGTDVVLANTAAKIATIREYEKQRCFVNFLKQGQVALHKKGTMAIATAATEEDFFNVAGHYFELSQGTANTELATTGLSPSASGWLLPGDNAAADYLELTRGIVLGSAQSFLVGTDAFFIRCAFMITTRANNTHLYMGFRKLGAYVDTKTNADHLAAYDDKVAIGISTNAGVITRHTSKATVDAALDAAHAAAADGDVLALEVSVSAAGTALFKLGHATPAGATYAQREAARVAALADLDYDATWSGTAITGMTAVDMVPYIAYGMAGGAAISDLRLMSFECDYA